MINNKLKFSVFKFYLKHMQPLSLIILTLIITYQSISYSVEAATKTYPLSFDIKNETDLFQNSLLSIEQNANHPAIKLANQALNQLQNGNREQSLTDLKRAWDMAPNLIEIGVIIGWIHLENKQFDKVLEIATKLQNQVPEKPFGFTLAAIAYRGLNNKEQAKVYFLKALKIYPGDPDAGNSLAQIALSKGNVDDARQIYNEVLDHNPNHLRTLLLLTNLEISSGDLNRVHILRTKTENALNEIIKNNQNAIRPKKLLARLYFSENRNQEAKLIIDKILQQSPNDIGLLEFSGVINLKLGLFEEAEAGLKKAIALSNKTPTLHYNLAEVYARSNRDNQALTEVNTALELSPNHAASQFLRATLLTSTGKLKEAQVLLEKLKLNNPNSLDIQELEATILLKEEKYAAAIKLINKILEKKSTNLLHIKLANAQKQTGDTNSAFNTLRGWLQKHPKDDLSRHVLADYLFSAELYKEAQQNYLEILKTQSNNIAVRNNLALIYMEQGLLDKGILEAEKNNALVPNNPAIMDTLALLLLHKGQLKKAESLLEKAITIIPGNKTVRFHLAQALSAEKTNKTKVSRAKQILNELLIQKGQFKERGAAEKLMLELESL